MIAFPDCMDRLERRIGGKSLSVPREFHSQSEYAGHVLVEQAMLSRRESKAAWLRARGTLEERNSIERFVGVETLNLVSLQNASPDSRLQMFPTNRRRRTQGLFRETSEVAGPDGPRCDETETYLYSPLTT